MRSATASMACAVLFLFASAAMARPVTRRLQQDENPACVCIEIYQPVCHVPANRTYGNSCHAWCAGVPGNETEPGECPPKSCVCTADYTPVCDPETNTTYSNACGAACNGVPQERLVPGECNRTAQGAPPTDAGAEAPLVGGKTPSDDCMCSAEYDPRCQVETGTTLSNPCWAQCAGLALNQTVPGECPRDRPRTNTPASSPAPTCGCTREYRPVCDTLSGVTYNNPCLARCANVTSAQAIPGACNASAASCAASCPRIPNTNVSSYDPVCVISRIGSGKWRITQTTTFFNPCIADCYASSVQGSYKGVCSAEADRACGSSVRPGSQVCSSSSLAEYPSRCYAERLQEVDVPVQTYSGQCLQREAVQIASRCPPTSPIAPEPTTNCLVDPCSVAPRCSTPGAVCTSRYCPGFFRSTFLSGVCQALWIDPAGNLDQACTFPNASDARRSV